MVFEGKWYRYFFGVLFVCSLSISVYFLFSTIINYRKTKNTISSTIQNNITEETRRAAQEINSFIALLRPAVLSLQDALSNHSYTKKDIEELLKKKPIEIFGLGVAYEPYAFDKETRLYAPYFFEQKGINTLTLIESHYDYAAPENRWFHEPLANGPGYTKPYQGSTSKTILIEYAAPFFSKKSKKPLGVIFANQSISHLNALLNSRYDKSCGYWFIVSQTGTYLAHPLSFLPKSQTTIFDTAKKYNQPEFSKAIQDALGGKPSLISYKNEVNGAFSWLITEPLPEIGGALCRVFDLSEIYTTPVNSVSLAKNVREQLKKIAICALVSLLLLVFFASLFFEQTPSLWWFLSTIVALFATAQILILWRISSLYPAYTESLTPLRGPSSLTSILEQYPAFSPSDYQIPTGIFINDITFKSTDEVEISCFIWQRYKSPEHNKLVGGFILPQAKLVRTQEIQRKKWPDGETILWQLDATLHQNLDYSRYPFDVKDIQISLWPREFNKKVVLIPDFTSYVLINPKSLPGINYNTYLEGWHLKGSYFGYESQSYLTSFGMYNQGAFGPYKQAAHFDTPELYFNMMIQRNLVDMIIEDLLPLIVIAVFLFLALLTAEQQGYGVLASIASVFFGIVVSHLNFQAKIPRYQLVYFEHFFLTLYGMTLLVTIVALLYVLRINIACIQYRSNLLPKLLYWPLLCTILLIATFIYLG